jgi:branched-chain amino acid transport system substrate-binding protein
MAVSASLPRMRLHTASPVKVGFLAPLSGDVMAWGEPGYQGCQLWAERVNAAGGLNIGGSRHRVELIAYDCQYDPDLALRGAQKLVHEDGVKFLLMLGGDTYPPVQNYLNQHKILSSTLLPSDLSPDTPYLIAPCELHPIYVVTGVDWLAENRPQLKKAAMCAQRDSLGLPSIATYRAAFEAVDIDVVKELFFAIADVDFPAIVASMLATKPDILCWDTAYEPFVHALTEEAFKQGFKGQIISCTADDYARLVARTSAQFMEGFVFQFPDFDDPALNSPRVNFSRPNEFYEAFNQRFRGNWSAVSWEYASILDLWKSAVESAGSIESVSVLAAMKAGGIGKHAFGEARWWGHELFGIDHALLGDWPVVEIHNGKAKIVEFRSIPDWWAKHGAILERHMRALGQMWDQRISPSPAADVVPNGKFLHRLAKG